MRILKNALIDIIRGVKSEETEPIEVAKDEIEETGKFAEELALIGDELDEYLRVAEEVCSCLIDFGRHVNGLSENPLAGEIAELADDQRLYLEELLRSKLEAFSEEIESRTVELRSLLSSDDDDDDDDDAHGEGASAESFADLHGLDPEAAPEDV